MRGFRTDNRHLHDNVVHVGGDLDMGSVPKLREVLRLALCRDSGPVVIDLGRATFIDAAGLGVLAWAANQARYLGRVVELRNVSASMDEVLQMTGIGQRFASPKAGPAPAVALMSKA